MIKHPSNNAFSLVELLIALAIGLIIIVTVISVYVSTTKKSRDLLLDIQLGEEITALSSLMLIDLRRAGFWQGAEPNSVNTADLSTQPFSLINVDLINDIAKYKLPFVININEKGDCISFAYDVAQDTLEQVDANDLFAFRLKQQQVQVLKNADVNAFAHDSCANNAGRWMSITDKRFVKIKKLHFSSQNSQCFNLTTQKTKQILNDEQLFPCLQMQLHSGDRMLEMRQVSFTIDAELASNPDIKRQRLTKVFIPNHLVFQIP